MRIAIVTMLLFGSTPAFTSQPGQPLDCSDMIMGLPGLSCTMLPLPPAPPGDCRGQYRALWKGGTSIVDNAGAVVWGESWTNWPYNSTHSIHRFDGVTDTIIASIQTPDDRPGEFLIEFRTAEGDDDQIFFDAVKGRLFIPVYSYCAPQNFPSCSISYQTCRILAIDGLGALFEVMQSYDPQASSIGLRLPGLPEGMPAADHYDTYTGTLTRPLDFSEAQPLRCNYPQPGPPQPGEYLTVPDTTPAPASGEATYFLTAATYQGQRRAGREVTDGIASGRDVSGLPACSLP